MNFWLLIIIPLISIFLWFYSTRKHPDTRPVRNQIQSYHRVSIKPCSTACQNVKELTGQLFTFEKVSSLPMLGCTTEACTCAYEHHHDRRVRQNRRFPSITLGGVSFEQKRFVADRRVQQIFDNHSLDNIDA